MYHNWFLIQNEIFKNNLSLSQAWCVDPIWDWSHTTVARLPDKYHNLTKEGRRLGLGYGGCDLRRNVGNVWLLNRSPKALSWSVVTTYLAHACYRHMHVIGTCMLSAHACYRHMHVISTCMLSADPDCNDLMLISNHCGLSTTPI